MLVGERDEVRRFWSGNGPARKLRCRQHRDLDPVGWGIEIEAGGIDRIERPETLNGRSVGETLVVVIADLDLPHDGSIGIRVDPEGGGGGGVGQDQLVAEGIANLLGTGFDGGGGQVRGDCSVNVAAEKIGNRDVHSEIGTEGCDEIVDVTGDRQL